MKVFGLGALSLLISFYGNAAEIHSNYCSKADNISQQIHQACEIQKSAAKCEEFFKTFDGLQTADLFNNCQPSSSSQLISMGVTCSPLMLVAGTSAMNAFRPGFGKMLPSSVIKLLPKVALTANVLAVPMTAYTLYDLTSKALENDKKCFEDIEGKTSSLMFLKLNGDHLIKSLEGITTTDQQKQFRFPEEYLKEDFIKNLSCSELRNLVTIQKRKQDVILGPLLAQQKIKEDPRKDYDLTSAEKDFLRVLSQNFECISPAKQVGLLCALGNTVMGGMAAKKFLKDLKSRPQDFNSLRVNAKTEFVIDPKADAKLKNKIDRRLRQDTNRNLKDPVPRTDQWPAFKRVIENSSRETRESIQSSLIKGYDGKEYGRQAWSPTDRKWYTDPVKVPDNAYDKFLKLGPKLRQLETDSGFMTHLPEFENFLKAKNIKISDTTDVFKLRDQFKEYLGKKTVYRAMALSEDELKKISTEGIQSNLLRELHPTSQKADSFEKFWLSKRQKDLYNTHIENDTDISPFISVTEKPDVGIGVAQAALRPGKKIYVFEMEVPEMDLIYNTTHAIGNSSHRISRETESLLQFKINPNEIKSVKEVSVGK